jgi:6-phosphogluconolactonase
MGADGHTASLFPGTPAIQEKERWVVANSADNVKTERVTFTLRVLNHAERVWFLVAGKDKAVTLAAVLQGESRAAYPSQMVHPQGELTWWTDEAAAELLAY